MSKITHTPVTLQNRFGEVLPSYPSYPPLTILKSKYEHSGAFQDYLGSYHHPNSYPDTKTLSPQPYLIPSPLYSHNLYLPDKQSHDLSSYAYPLFYPQHLQNPSLLLAFPGSLLF